MAPNCFAADVVGDLTTLGIAGVALFGLGALVAVIVRANRDYHHEHEGDR